VLEGLRGVWYSSGVSGDNTKSFEIVKVVGAMVRVGRRRGLFADLLAIAADVELKGAIM
jgi:hypothetical protein